ncbi:hypothetical protein L596_018212 [Steinernema carpocapsae]|uniref:DUF2428 domain-containing protein n=1 Tax=Steinernema carpocapsae TaxID=34508 RepID=A0A4U5N402_STECR|nr:hypothetical protein L596_018212 [Steinernema carpocapsae]
MAASAPETFVFLADVAAKKIPDTEEVRHRLLLIVRTDTNPDGARLLASQLFFRLGREFGSIDPHNEFLVAGFAEECDAKRRSWLLSKAHKITWNPVVIQSFLRGFTKSKQTPKIEEIECLWTELHRIWHRPRLSESVRWCLQKVYELFDQVGVSYDETFQFYLLDVQRLVKQRYTALALLIPKITIEKLKNDLDILFYDLKSCQNHQHLSSITSECVVAIGKRLPKDPKLFEFLLDVFQSESRQIRFSALRFWIAQLAAEKVFKSLFSNLLERLRKPENIEADTDTANLTDIDFYWGLDDHEVDPDSWDKDDRRIFAFLVVLQSSMRCFGYKICQEKEAPLIAACLKHRRNLIRIEALNLTKDLEMDLEEFYLENAATDDSQLRDAMKKRMTKWKPSEKAFERMLRWLKADSNQQRIAFVLDTVERIGIRVDTGCLEALTIHTDSDVRWKAISLLKCQGATEFFEKSFLENTKNADLAAGFAGVLVDIGESYFVKEHLDSLNKVLQISLRSKLSTNFAEFLAICEPLIEENLVLSGSSKLGECTSMAELNSRMAIHETVLISDQCTENISSYAGVLIGCSKCLVDRVWNEPLEAKKQVLRLIWTILLRSRHKGVVDDCATQFERLRSTISDEESREILNDTMTLFGDEKCSSRNLAFWRILLCFPNQTKKIIEELIGNMTSEREIVVLRSLKIFKAFIGSSKHTAACRVFYAEVLNFILEEYAKSSWAVRSSMNHLFEVLVHTMFSRIPSNVPLCNFIADYKDMWNVLVLTLKDIKSAMDSNVVLVLSILERVLVVDNRLHRTVDLRTIEVIKKKLLDLYATSKQIRISELLIDCLLNFTVLGRWYEIEDTFRRSLNAKSRSASDHFCVVHALRRISEELRHPIRMPVDHYFEEREMLGAYHSLNNLKANFEVFFEMATSPKELSRLCAAYSLPYQWAKIEASDAKRLYAATVCLLSDEIEAIRMRACKALVGTDSSSPILGASEIAKKCAEQIVSRGYCSREELIDFWKTFLSASEREIKSYNRYFEGFVVEEFLGC